MNALLIAGTFLALYAEPLWASTIGVGMMLYVVLNPRLENE